MAYTPGAAKVPGDAISAAEFNALTAALVAASAATASANISKPGPPVDAEWSTGQMWTDVLTGITYGPKG